MTVVLKINPAKLVITLVAGDYQVSKYHFSGDCAKITIKRQSLATAKPIGDINGSAESSHNRCFRKP
jgi:hypothetical protein